MGQKRAERFTTSGGRAWRPAPRGPLRLEEHPMNVWKPRALVPTSHLVRAAGYQTAPAKAAAPAPTSVEGDYRRMHAALDALRVARDHLMNAEHNHGGWRERAGESTDRRIHE